MPAALNSPADDEVLAATAALVAAGKDPFGDDDDDETLPAADVADDNDNDDDAGDPPAETTPAADADPEKKVEEPNNDDALDADALEALAADDEPAAAPERRFNAGDPSKFEEQRAALLAEKAAAFKGVMDGTIEPEAYSATESAVQVKLDRLLVQQTLHEANVQSAQQSEASAIEALMASSKKANEIDYVADTKAQVQFDAALNMLALDPDNVKMPYAQRVAEAHKVVLALRGLAKPAVVDTPKPAAAVARENGKGPVTLRNIPAAASPNAGGGIVEQMSALSGQEYQAAFERLTPAQRAQVLGE